jgi:hypothetical protein
MSNKGDVKYVITQLQSLQIQQATLISYLERLREAGDNAGGPTLETGTTPEF